MATAPETKGRAIRSWARFYDAASWLMTFGRDKAIRKEIVELAQVAKGERVLDVGCGTGSLALAAKAKAGLEGEVVGIDASPEMIEVAREKTAKRGASVDFQVGLIEEIPFPDGSFDLVLSSFMLHHLPDEVKRKGLVEIRRVLKPGGRFLVVDLASHGDSLLDHVRTALFGHGAHGHAIDLKAMLEEAGFGEAEVLQTRFKQLSFVRGAAAEAVEASR